MTHQTNADQRSEQREKRGNAKVISQINVSDLLNTLMFVGEVHVLLMADGLIGRTGVSVLNKMILVRIQHRLLFVSKRSFGSENAQIRVR